MVKSLILIKIFISLLFSPQIIILNIKFHLGNKQLKDFFSSDPLKELIKWINKLMQQFVFPNMCFTYEVVFIIYQLLVSAICYLTLNIIYPLLLSIVFLIVKVNVVDTLCGLFFLIYFNQRMKTVIKEYYISLSV